MKVTEDKIYNTVHSVINTSLQLETKHREAYEATNNEDKIAIRKELQMLLQKGNKLDYINQNLIAEDKIILGIIRDFNTNSSKTLEGIAPYEYRFNSPFTILNELFEITKDIHKKNLKKPYWHTVNGYVKVFENGKHIVITDALIVQSEKHKISAEALPLHSSGKYKITYLGEKPL